MKFRSKSTNKTTNHYNSVQDEQEMVSGAIVSIVLIIFFVALILFNVFMPSTVDPTLYKAGVVLIGLAGFVTGIQKGRPGIAVFAILLMPIGSLLTLVAKDMSIEYTSRPIPAKGVWWWAALVSLGVSNIMLSDELTKQIGFLIVCFIPLFIVYIIAICSWWRSESILRFRRSPSSFRVISGYLLFGMGSVSPFTVFIGVVMPSIAKSGSVTTAAVLFGIVMGLAFGLGLVALAAVCVFERKDYSKVME